jgi:hypothetical protein
MNTIIYGVSGHQRKMLPRSLPYAAPFADHDREGGSHPPSAIRHPSLEPSSTLSTCAMPAKQKGGETERRHACGANASCHSLCPFALRSSNVGRLVVVALAEVKREIDR